MSSYFDAMDQRISAVRESPVAGHLQAPWKTLSHVTQGPEDIEITAAASLDGIATIAMWRRERGADGDFKPWVATALDGQFCEARNVYAIEGELVPTEPPYAHIDCARALAEIEGELVRDVTVRVMFPDFPEDLREAIHRTVLRYGVTMIPDLAYPADFETFQEHQARLHTLSGDLHTIFHEVARTEASPTVRRWGCGSCTLRARHSASRWCWRCRPGCATTRSAAGCGGSTPSTLARCSRGLGPSPAPAAERLASRSAGRMANRSPMGHTAPPRDSIPPATSAVRGVQGDVGRQTPPVSAVSSAARWASTAGTPSETRSRPGSCTPSGRADLHFLIDRILSRTQEPPWQFPSNRSRA